MLTGGNMTVNNEYSISVAGIGPNGSICRSYYGSSYEEVIEKISSDSSLSDYLPWDVEALLTDMEIIDYGVFRNPSEDIFVVLRNESADSDTAQTDTSWQKDIEQLLSQKTASEKFRRKYSRLSPWIITWGTRSQ
jgi:hypothetical protein